MVLMSLRLIIEDDEGSTTIVPLGKESITIGRQTGNTIQLTEKNVSRRHARLTPDGDAWVIEDLGSYNGVKVNGRPVDARVVLQEGDVVQIGDYHLALTEDVDRRSLNYDRPRGAAANDGEPMLASSSTNLPRMSQAELAALASGQHPTAIAPPQVLLDSGQMPMARVAPPYGEEPRRRSGVLVAIGLVAIGGIALGGFWMVANGGPSGKPADTTLVAKNDARSTAPAATAPTKMPEPAAVVPTEPQPSVTPAPPVAEVEEKPTPAAAVEAKQAVPAVADDPDVVVDEPPEEALPNKPVPVKKATPTPKKPPPPAPTPKPTPAPAPTIDADQLLADARGMFLKNPSQAYELASKAYGAKKTQDAAFVMANAACRIPDEGKARKSIAKLKGDKRDAAIKICASKGITIE
jgi:predicted component of type VI protein secretion system